MKIGSFMYPESILVHIHDAPSVLAQVSWVWWMTENERQFIICLEKLTRETGVAIGTYERVILDIVDPSDLDHAAGYAAVVVEYDDYGCGKPEDDVDVDVFWVAPNHPQWETHRHLIVKA